MRRCLFVQAWLAAALFGCVVCRPLAAEAVTIANLGIAKNAGNSADFFDDIGDQASAAQSTVGVVSSSSSAFNTRYAAVVSADRGGGGPSGTTTQNFTGNFSITFELTANAGWDWSFTLDVLRIGARTIISDGTGNASVALGALTGTETGAGSVTSGSLSLGGFTTLSNASNQGSSPNSAFNQATSAVISGIGTGSAQIVTLNFLFTASASSVDPPGGSIQGDEAALRMGLDSALSYFAADDYPGVGLRNLSTDGIFVMLSGLVEAPEPGTALLFGLGLAGLALHRRRLRR
jgi:hypothetical protein